MHGKATLFWLALLFTTLAVSGCSQPCYLRDYDALLERAGLPPDLETNPYLTNQPTVELAMRSPMTINDLDREPNYVTLAECIALALENGTTGTQSLRSFFNQAGILSSGNNIFLDTVDLVTFNGVQAVGSDSVRVFALTPATVATDIEASLARYDAVFRTILGFNNTDANPLGPNNFRSGSGTAFGMSIDKALPTGGLANITFGSPTNAGSNPGTNFYNNFRQPGGINGLINPSYSPSLTFGFQQPLLRGFGPYINSLLTQHPLSPSQQLPGSAAATAPAIVIARINFNQSRAEFERQVNFMVLNVETCYHTLYALYVNLYSTEQALRQSHMAWKISKRKYEAGSIPVTQYAQTRAQYEDFRAQRLLAVNKVLEQERELRVLCGMKLEDGKRLVPVDTPTLAKYIPDWESALHEALSLRPELLIAREDVHRRQLELSKESNNLLPDLRLEANYGLTGFGTRLDGNGTFPNGQTDNALRDLSGSHFGNYNIGFTFAMPLGFRAQHASLRAAELRLAQAFLVLRDQERKAQSNLIVTYRNLISDYEVMTARRAQREAAAEQVEARFKEFEAGKSTVDFLLEAQRQWANALSQEYNAIANYNFDLVAFQFSKGTLLQHNSIQIAESGLPQCVAVRAVEHERQRAHAIACRERAEVVQQPGFGCVPNLPVITAPSLPAIGMDNNQRVPQNGEEAAPVRVLPNNASAGMTGNQWPATSEYRQLPKGPTVTPVNVTVSPASASTMPALTVPERR